MKIEITMENRVISATLNDSDSAKDLASLLPLTLTMEDLLDERKYGHLPRAISGRGERTHTYQVGDLVYWLPSPDVAIFYRHDGQKIPSPGIIVLGRLDSDVKALKVRGSIKVTIRLASD